jgi:hypothetical protein
VSCLEVEQISFLREEEGTITLTGISFIISTLVTQLCELSISGRLSFLSNGADILTALNPTLDPDILLTIRTTIRKYQSTSSLSPMLFNRYHFNTQTFAIFSNAQRMASDGSTMT